MEKFSILMFSPYRILYLINIRIWLIFVARNYGKISPEGGAGGGRQTVLAFQGEYYIA